MKIEGRRGRRRKENDDADVVGVEVVVVVVVMEVVVCFFDRGWVVPGGREGSVQIRGAAERASDSTSVD